MARPPYVAANGDLVLTSSCTVVADDVEVRVTTSGGPGGQHANRSLTAVVVSVAIETAASLRERDRRLLLEALGPVVRSQATRFRSQAQNREAALHQLALKLAAGLHRDAPRRPTKPTRASATRRVDSKKARGRTKALRRSNED
jgi:ribosome-associated protein